MSRPEQRCYSVVVRRCRQCTTVPDTLTARIGIPLLHCKQYITTCVPKVYPTVAFRIDSNSTFHGSSTTRQQQHPRFGDGIHRIRPRSSGRLMLTTVSDQFYSIPLSPNDESCSEGVSNEIDFSLTALQERMCRYVNQYTSKEYNKNKKRHCKLVSVIAGGGGHFLSTLAATSGASSILAEGNILYERKTYHQYVLQNIKQQPWNRTHSEPRFQYSSMEATFYLAQAAMYRSVRFNAINVPPRSTDNKTPLTSSMASTSCCVACSSSLQTNTSKRSDRVSRAYITAFTTEGMNVSMQVQLGKSLSVDKLTNRNRFDEDVFVSHCILSCVEYADAVERQRAGEAVTLASTVTTLMGDEIKWELHSQEASNGQKKLDPSLTLNSNVNRKFR